MIVAFDEDLLAPMLAGWQKVADCYRPRVYVFRAARGQPHDPDRRWCQQHQRTFARQ